MAALSGFRKPVHRVVIVPKDQDLAVQRRSMGQITAIIRGPRSGRALLGSPFDAGEDDQQPGSVRRCVPFNRANRAAAMGCNKSAPKEPQHRVLVEGALHFEDHPAYMKPVASLFLRRLCRHQLHQV